MRIIKLSPDDEEMTSRDAVMNYFTETLWRKSRFGRFGLTLGKSTMRGIEKGALLLFTYETECVFLGRAAGSIQLRNDPDSPAFIPISMGELVPVAGSLGDFETALRKRGLSQKSLVRTQSWPALDAPASAFAETYFKYASALRFVFVRVGWMQHYRGVTIDDERPVGGGGYNKNRVGHENCNFLPLHGKFYGYYQPQMRSDQTRLERIDSSAAATTDHLDDVTVIWVAKRPKEGQQIVGWFRGAKVFRELGPKVIGRPADFENYRCSTAKERGVLLPVAAREFLVPPGKGGIGQANVCYPLEVGGARKESQWMLKALCYLAGYAGDNLAVDAAAGALNAVAKELQAAQDRRGGQGFGGTVDERSAIEEQGMAVAIAHYVNRGYEVRDVSKRQPYDLHCIKGRKELRVEVKATTNTAEKVFLTRRETLHAMNPGFHRALFILHSIHLKDGEASGGVPAIIEPWTLDLGDATPVIYSYRPPVE